MSNSCFGSSLHCFLGPGGVSSVQLPFDLDQLIDNWSVLRILMARRLHVEFTRAEWAYLIQFTDPIHLRSIFQRTLGLPTAIEQVNTLLTPRERVALWLPNNVSLLGPLTLILLSLTGANVRIKTGSRSQNLCSSFVKWLCENSVSGPLCKWLENSVTVETFDRNDQRNSQMAAWADTRIFFGSDAAAEAIEGLPHPINSVGFYFVNKVSEAWIQHGTFSEAVAMDLARVFSVYGQAGCTSPKRVALIDGNADAAFHLANNLANIWDAVQPDLVPDYLASENTMARQWAQAQGLKVKLLGCNSGIAVISHAGALPVVAHMALCVQWGSLEQILASQPENLQSIGYVLQDVDDPRWLLALSRSPAVRFVPLVRMHQFSPIWDGVEWWKSLFNTTILKRETSL